VCGFLLLFLPCSCSSGEVKRTKNKKVSMHQLWEGNKYYMPFLRFSIDPPKEFVSEFIIIFYFNFCSTSSITKTQNQIFSLYFLMHFASATYINPNNIFK